MPTPWTRRILLANLVAQVGIVLTGGLVRLTGSGLGCSTFPECEPGQWTSTFQPETGIHGFVEFGNRLLAFVVLAFSVAAVVAVWRLRPRRRDLRLIASAVVVGVLGQALVGGLSVLFDLSPLVVAGHFLFSMVLIALSTVLLLRSAGGEGPGRPLVRRSLRRLGAAVAAATATTLVLGTLVTGSGPHSGDADEPNRLPLELEAITRLHGDAVAVLAVAVVALAVLLRVTGAPARTQRWSAAVLGVVLVQGLLGVVQYALELPIALVWAHMLGACLLVVMVTGLQLGLRERAAVAPPAPRAPEVARV